MGYSNDAVKPMGYAAKGRYVAQTAGSVHVAKREAEAEPTHTIGYNTYQTSPLSYVSKPIVAASAYSNFGYSGLYNQYSTAFPYMHSYGKREAEAEPQYYGSFYGNRAFTYGGIQTPYQTYNTYNSYPSRYYY